MNEGLSRKLEPGASGQLQEVRFFTDDKLQTALDGALTGISERSVVLQVEANPTGWNAVVAAKLDGHWSVVGGWQRSDWGDSLGAKVKLSW